MINFEKQISFIDTLVSDTYSNSILWIPLGNHSYFSQLPNSIVEKDYFKMETSLTSSFVASSNGLDILLLYRKVVTKECPSYSQELLYVAPANKDEFQLIEVPIEELFRLETLSTAIKKQIDSNSHATVLIDQYVSKSE